MEVKREHIDYDPRTGKLTTIIDLRLTDGNGMILKAKAEMYADIMDGVGKLIDAKIAEFAERYGEEVIKFAHDNLGSNTRDIAPSPVKFVDSRKINRKLLDKAFA